MKFEKETILAQLEKIISDKVFSRSKTNCRLLKFLVDATINNEDIKETTIGKEFFGAKYDPVKSDNNVRVYIYHLRKKLNEYYASNGQAGNIVFSIAKGQYNVQFEEYKKASEPKKYVPHRMLLWGFINISILALLVFFQFHKAPANNFWRTLMKNDYPTTVIFGDYFTIETEIKTGRKGIIRDYEINSEKELKDYLEENPLKEGEMIPSNHHYFNWMAPHCSMNMAEFWSKYDYSYDIVQVSEWSVSQLENDNLVYFGQSKSMGTLKNILEEKFPHYSYGSQQIIRTDPLSGKKVKYWDIIRKNGKNIDYTIVAKVAMSTGNEMRFFLSDQDCGAISALQYFTNNDSVAAFYNRHELKQEDDFIALFKVTGWERKTYDMEFVSLDKRK